MKQTMKRTMKRAIRAVTIGGATARTFFRPGAYLMWREMLAGIKRRAEHYTARPRKESVAESEVME